MPGSLVGFLADGAACGMAQFDDASVRGRELLEGRTFWNVSSSANGGGVAEMLRSLIGSARGGGLDARWVTIGGDADFFRLTKRAAQARVRDLFLGPRHLGQYVELLEKVPAS